MLRTAFLQIKKKLIYVGLLKATKWKKFQQEAMFFFVITYMSVTENRHLLEQIGC
jgi:hypothetical protein